MYLFKLILPVYFAVLSLPCTYDPNDWIECESLYVTKHSPSQEDLVMWMNTYSQPLYPVAENYPFPGDWSEADRWMEKYGWAGRSYPDNEWVTVSVSDRVPEEAKAIFLTGKLIITNGTSHLSGNMTITFRRKGEDKEHKYLHQTCVRGVPGSARSTMSLWVPLDENKEFEFKWTRETFGQWPEQPAYGIALALNAWAK